MKKLYTLFLFLAMFALQGNAQITTLCNPDFTSQFLTGSAVKFTPAVNDSPLVQHYWRFGDGSSPSNIISPTHTYGTGVFNVTHIIVRHNPNGVQVCIDSLIRQITITQATCNLTASFSHYTASTNSLQVTFTNTSAGFATGDSIRWTFGDGTVSYELNPTHIYTSGGTYTVCLRVKKQPTTASTYPCVSETCQQVTVAPPVNTCNLQVYFSFMANASGPALIHFTNQSPGYLPTDSITWNYGDGTSSNDVNPNHTFAAGTYNVCLIIRRNTIAGTTPCVRYYCKTVTITAPPPCNLNANFTWYRDSTIANTNTYRFTNTSVPLYTTDSIRWTFGDGTSSNQVSPNHSYAQAGTYNVCLRVQKRTSTGVLTDCIREVCYSVNVPPTINLCNLQVYFSIDSLQPGVRHFTNQSINYNSTDSITWTFGDGTTSHEVNPTHTFSAPGTYNVCLIIKKNNASGTSPCIRYYCKTVVIAPASAPPCNLNANFTRYRDSTIANTNTYHFTNTSVPLYTTDSIRWTFGDGTSSNQVSPNHTYVQAGTYNACLRVQKRTSAGVLTDCIREVCHTVVVVQQCTLQASYTKQADPLNLKKIYFTNTTIVPATNISVTWYFGDGTSASSWNAVHEYAQAGRYYACLRVQYGSCVSYKCDSITISVPAPNCTQLSAYHFLRSTANANIITFTPNYISTDVQYTWTFGDGTGSHDPTATHQFAGPGYYTVCLTAYRNNTCASTTCQPVYITSVPNCYNITLGFNDTRDPLVPNRITFVANANSLITDQVWAITKIPTTATTGTAVIHQNNPTYVFLDSGYYNVCLRATFPGGCVKEYCKTIHITQSMPGTNSCTLQVYPNPASSAVNAIITLAQPLVLNAYVYNSLNMPVAQNQQQGVVGNNTVGVNIANLPAGIYMLRVTYGTQACYATFLKQ